MACHRPSTPASLSHLGHRCQNLLKLFNRIARRDLTPAQFSLPQTAACSLQRPESSSSSSNDLADPLTKRSRIRQNVFHLSVMEQLALGHIHGNHLARTKRAFFNNVIFVNRHHAGFGTGNQKPIACDRVPHRAQAIPVQTRTNPTAIRHRQSGGAIPRLHHRVAVGIHVAPRLSGNSTACFDQLPAPASSSPSAHSARRAPIPRTPNPELRSRGPDGNDRLDVFRHVSPKRCPTPCRISWTSSSSRCPSAC